MKTFVEFILICEKLNKTHDENSQSKLWNYFIANPDDRKIRDLILNNDLKKAEEEIKKQVFAAKTNPEHPLNFTNAGDEEFSKKEGRQPKDELDYNNFLDDSVSGLLALSKQKKLRSAIEKGFPSRVTGSGASELSKKFKKAGGTDKTPKGDLEIYNPDNPKDRRGISMKRGAGAQLASAEGGELKGMYKIAAREFVKKFHSDKSKEERGRIEKEIMSDAERLSAIGRLQKTAGEASDVDKQKQSLKNVSQGISDRLLDKYPQFERLLSQVATSGKGKFKGNEGTAGIVLTGKNKDKEASAKPAEQQKSSKPRLALPKGTSRPGNLKIDYRPEESKSNQAQPEQGPQTLQQFTRKARISELKAKKEAQAQQAVEAEAEAQAELAQAEKAKERAERIIGPGGKRVLRQYVGAFLANNPDKAQQRSLKISAAQQNIDASTANINSIQQQKADAQAATTPEQPQPSTPEQVPPQEQVPPEQQQQQAPPQEQVPPEQQQQQAPPQEQVPPEQQAPPPEEQKIQPEKKPKKKGKVEPENVEQTTEPVV